MTAAAVRISPLAVVDGPWGAVPSTLKANGWRIDGAAVGDTMGNYKIVDVVYSGDRPTQYHTLTNESLSLSGNVLTITRTWTPPTLAAARVILKDKLQAEATARWVASRGTKEVDIEAAVSSGVSNIDGANNLASALAAFNAVMWP